jgi:hypothetical protein
LPPASPAADAETVSIFNSEKQNMSFALYMIGFLLFLAGLAWGASVMGVPTLYIGIGALILLGIGIFSAVGRTRSKDPS